MLLVVLLVLLVVDFFDRIEPRRLAFVGRRKKDPVPGLLNDSVERGGGSELSLDGG